MYKTIGSIVYDFSYTSSFDNNQNFLTNSFWAQDKTKAIVLFSITIFLLFPLCMIKDYSKFGFLSTFTLISLIYITLVVCIQMPFYIEHRENSRDYNNYVNWFDISLSFSSQLLFFPVFACMLYTNGNAAFALPILKKLKNSNEHNTTKVALCSESLIFLVYMIIGIVGYLSVPQDTPKLIIFRNTIFENDALMTVGKILFSISLITNFATNFNLIRISGLKILLRNDSDNTSLFTNFLFTLIILVLVSTISTFSDDIINILSIIGGFTVVIIHYSAIGLMYLKGNDNKIYSLKNIIMIITILVLLGLGLTGGIISIRNTIETLN